MTCKREAEFLAEIEQAGAMYKVSTLQLIKAGSRIAELEALNSALCRDNAGLTAARDDLQLAFSRCNETKTALQMNLRGVHKERDALASQNQALRDALGEAMGWNWLSDVESIPDSVSNQLADALTLPDTSADILRARDARVLRDMADRLHDHYATGGSFTEAVWVIRKAANELEQAK